MTSYNRFNFGSPKGPLFCTEVPSLFIVLIGRTGVSQRSPAA